MEHEDRLTNEANVIQNIRSTMIQLKTLAVQFKRNYLEQYEMHINDVNVPSKAGRFTSLDENQNVLFNEYSSTLSEIELQLTIYDKFCKDNKLDHSKPWTELLNDLRPYQSEIRALADYLLSNDPTAFA